MTDVQANAERIVAAAMELPREIRAEHVRRSCGGNSALRQRAESLLAACEASASFLETPALAMANAARSDAAPATQRAGEPVLDDRIGRYRIIRTLGVGGMGVVYLAEQDNPRRTVALKVVRPGLATEDLLKRFELEADILARLRHPGIAQIYEAGTADTGHGVQPYLAMELIHGPPIDAHATERGLSVRERLELIAKVCDAAHHAHQRGVVHRDLKPGNILVDESGGGGEGGGVCGVGPAQPKVLDFGVARFAGVDGARAPHTLTGQLVGTLEFMSPEQASGDPGSVDTRADVYALGAILYLLLTGRTPQPPGEGGILEAARAIREVEPPRVGSLDPTLRGDVETIVAKALEKDKDRRYQSASDLAADIRRYLADEPITARPASTLYLLRKFARRNRTLVGGAIATCAALLLGLAGTIWFAISSAHQASEARRAHADMLGSFTAVRRHLMTPDAVYATSRRLLERLRPNERPGFPGRTLLILESPTDPSRGSSSDIDLVLLDDAGAVVDKCPSVLDVPAWVSPALAGPRTFQSAGGVLIDGTGLAADGEQPPRELVVVQTLETGPGRRLTAISVTDLEFHVHRRLWSISTVRDVYWDGPDRLLVVTVQAPLLAYCVPQLASYDTAGCPDEMIEPRVAVALRPEDATGLLLPRLASETTPSDTSPIAHARWAVSLEPGPPEGVSGSWQVNLHSVTGSPKADDAGTLAGAGVLHIQFLRRKPEPGQHFEELWASTPLSGEGAPLGAFQFEQIAGKAGPSGVSGPPDLAAIHLVPIDLAAISRAMGVAVPLFRRGLTREEMDATIDADATLAPDVRRAAHSAAHAMWTNWRWLNNEADHAQEIPAVLDTAIRWAEAGVGVHQSRCPHPDSCKGTWYILNTLATLQERAGRRDQAISTLTRCERVWAAAFPSSHGDAVDQALLALVEIGRGHTDAARNALGRARAIVALGPLPEGLDPAAQDTIRQAETALSGGSR